MAETARELPQFSGGVEHDEPRIRPYRQSDLDDLYRICLLTGANGGDASHCCWGLNAADDTISVPPYGPVSVKSAVRVTVSPVEIIAQRSARLNVRVTLPSSVAAPIAQASYCRVRTPAEQALKVDAQHAPA